MVALSALPFFSFLMCAIPAWAYVCWLHVMRSLAQGTGRKNNGPNMRFDGIGCAPPTGPSLRGELTRPSVPTEGRKQRLSVSVTKVRAHTHTHAGAAICMPRCSSNATSHTRTLLLRCFTFLCFSRRRRPVAHMHTRTHKKRSSAGCACLRANRPLYFISVRTLPRVVCMRILGRGVGEGGLPPSFLCAQRLAFFTPLSPFSAESLT